MKKLTTIILISVTVLATVATLGFAASDSATVTVNFSVNAKQSLKIKSNPGSGNSNTVESTFHIPTPSDKDLKNGHTITREDVITLVATSNVDFELNVRANNSSLGMGKDGYRMYVRGQGEFKQVSTNPVTIADGEPGKHEFSVDHRVKYYENYEPGNYEEKLVFNISSA